MFRKILFLWLLLLSVSGFAQDNGYGRPYDHYDPRPQRFSFVTPSRFTPSGSWTDDSSVTFSADADPSISWIWFKITKDGQSLNSFLPMSPAGFMRKLYLPLGPGQYTIEIFTTSNPERYRGQYLQGGRFDVENTDERPNMDALVPTDVIQSDSAEITTLAQTITQGLSTDLEKTKAIHDWVAGAVAYDVKAYMTGSYLTMEHDALTVLSKKVAICEGYSNLTAALNRAAGIPARKVTGEGIKEGSKFTGIVNHAWNEVLVDSRWILQDTTWDAGFIDFKNNFVKRLRTKYFDPDPSEFAKTHRKIESTNP
jgi:transglutaminase-like putative cysteine protease